MRHGLANPGRHAPSLAGARSTPAQRGECLPRGTIRPRRGGCAQVLASAAGNAQEPQPLADGRARANCDTMPGVSPVGRRSPPAGPFSDNTVGPRRFLRRPMFHERPGRAARLPAGKRRLPCAGPGGAAADSNGADGASSPARPPARCGRGTCERSGCYGVLRC